MAPGDRYELLRRVAQRIRERRADLMGAAMADAGKTLTESDPEVSEAIDFAEFYAKTALEIQQTAAYSTKPRGVVVVISPWNFPIAIPFGGIAAALAAGNTVILKPATETALVARVLCECIWEAGVPRQAVQLVVCDGPEASNICFPVPSFRHVSSREALKPRDAFCRLDLTCICSLKLVVRTRRSSLR